MQKQINCKQCDTLIATEENQAIMPRKTGDVRYLTQTKELTIKCNQCNFVTVLDGLQKGNSEKHNAKNILDKFSKKQ